MENKKEKFKTKQQAEEKNDLPLVDYHSFNLSHLAQKIKMQNYRPKPKMLYY